MKTNSFVIEQPSGFDFDTTVNMIVKEAESRDWKVPAIHDLQLSLAKAGKTVLPVKVIEICKTAYSGQILELNDERLMSVMMPCRVSVYLKNDGKTYTSVMNEAEMSDRMPEKVALVMKAASEETREIVKTVTC